MHQQLWGGLQQRKKERGKLVTSLVEEVFQSGQRREKKGKVRKKRHAETLLIKIPGGGKKSLRRRKTATELCTRSTLASFGQSLLERNW